MPCLLHWYWYPQAQELMGTEATPPLLFLTGRKATPPSLGLTGTEITYECR